MKSAKELKALIKLLRSHGVVSYEHDGLKLLLNPDHQVSAVKPLSRKAKYSQDLEEQVQKLNTLPEMSDEDWLLATNLSNGEDEAINA